MLQSPPMRALRLTAILAAVLASGTAWPGDPAAVERACTRALEADPGNAQACWDRGRARLALGNEAGAREDLERWLEFDPKYALVMADLGLLLFTDDREPRCRQEEALALAAEAEGSALAAFRHWATAYALTVGEAEEMRRADALIAAWTRCRLRPGYPLPLKRYLARGQALVQQRLHEQAAIAYVQAARYCPWAAEAHFNAALLLGEYQHYPKAVAAMRRARALLPEGPQAQEAEGMLVTWELLE